MDSRPVCLLGRQRFPLARLRERVGVRAGLGGRYGVRAVGGGVNLECPHPTLSRERERGKKWERDMKTQALALLPRSGERLWVTAARE